MIKQVPIRLEEGFIRRIKIICAKEGSTFQDTAKTLLEKWVEEKEGNAK